MLRVLGVLVVVILLTFGIATLVALAMASKLHRRVRAIRRKIGQRH